MRVQKRPEVSVQRGSWSVIRRTSRAQSKHAYAAHCVHLCATVCNVVCAAMLQGMRSGHGENGRAVSVPRELEAEAKDKYRVHQFNLIASDLVSVNRSLPDYRSWGYAAARALLLLCVHPTLHPHTVHYCTSILNLIRSRAFVTTRCPLLYSRCPLRRARALALALAPESKSESRQSAC